LTKTIRQTKESTNKEMHTASHINKL